MTILVVDDEQYVRDEVIDLLKKVVNSLCFSCEGNLKTFLTKLRIVTASDGASGLEQALLTPPDLLITDVQMPRMNGLELTEQVQKLISSCRTVFMSNYSDKEYLRGAIHLHAVEYIDKPIDPKHFKELITELLKQYSVEFLERKNRESIASENLKNAKLILAKLWSQMLRNKNANLESIRPQCIRYNMEHFFRSAYRCLLFRVSCREYTDFPISAPDGVEMLPCDYSEKGIMILVLYSEKPEALADNMIRSFWASMRRFPQITGLGVGPIAADYREVFRTWQIARSAFNQLFFCSEPQLIFQYQPTAAETNSLNEESLKKILSAFSDPNASQSDLDILFTSLQTKANAPVNDIRNYFCKAAELILQYSAKNLLDFHEKHTNFELYQEVWEAGNLEELSFIVRHWMEELFSQGVGDDRTVRMTTAYIQKNYHNPDLNLDDLCNFTGYSKSYLCTVFKRLTGIGLNTYMNKVRIDAACHLLLHTDKALEEIATEVGFSNQGYFGRVFKSIMQQTPKKFRNTNSSK